MPLHGEYLPSTSEWARTQAETFEASRGAEANEMQGKPVIVLTTVGAKTGGLRKTALMRVEHDGEYAVVASRGGAPEHPAWYWNMKKNAHVELQDGEEVADYVARELDGDERSQWWARANAVWPHYEEYQQKTERVIPVFVLEPIS
ncbi:nitroreductase family deazaflavin-dependent oxidoreductase [Microbacterium sp. H1-D42]|uniref:nitroreductase family deazaflavin-dependent oxidoreductase n=1 Tax=Microbacterium sp. H1-D42 TaxID=2925844 RepID=UPI001F537DB3|nr:nitroreductase family deazaflavin-dependent oxidoreductase [Microbacterium sp. H1-D42]UNK71508.1 nitroreductase family deazaflavin-dependent oxidoreductase [Microbacterium sp. H1-D42]